MMKSTMNAPLSESEEAHILDKWNNLKLLCRYANRDSNPLDMLDYCTDLVGAVWELRRAIDDGWHGANRRAFPSPEPAKKKHTLNLYQGDFEKHELVARILDDLKTSGYTDEQLIAAMKESQK